MPSIQSPDGPQGAVIVCTRCAHHKLPCDNRRTCWQCYSANKPCKRRSRVPTAQDSTRSRGDETGDRVNEHTRNVVTTKGSRRKPYRNDPEVRRSSRLADKAEEEDDLVTKELRAAQEEWYRERMSRQPGWMMGSPMVSKAGPVCAVRRRMRTRPPPKYGSSSP
jgi:hypothetical protein